MVIKPYKQLTFLSLVTMATSKIVYRAFLTLIRKVVTEIFWILVNYLGIFGVSMAIKLYNQLKFLNLVTMTTTKIV